MVMEIIREGLIITPTGSLEPSQGSYDVPVSLENDDTYTDYTISMYVGYYVNGVLKKRKCETDSEGHYLIPGIAFFRSGIISISFLLETADKSQGLMTNALSYEIKHAPNVVVETPPDPTWQELVKEWIQELAGAVNVDNTLTKSGMAADAKATGDAISKLSDEIGDLRKVKSLTSNTTVADMLLEIYRKLFPVGDLVDTIGTDIPVVTFTADNWDDMTKDNAIDVAMTYESDSLYWNGVANIKWQGNSSLNYDKKNFTIKLYKDSTKEEKQKINFNDWGSQTKFCLKANYIDHSHARNIVSARLWNDIVESRDNYSTLPQELRNSPNNGAIDGFPIKVTVNGVYQGVYTWNIPKDGWAFNMSEDNVNHCVLCCEYNWNNGTSACEFRANAKLDGSDWSVEFPETATSQINISFNRMVDIIKDSTDEVFYASIDNYLDINSALDYYLYAYFGGFVDSLSRNMMLLTYNGTKWYAHMYDMDSTWGIDPEGDAFYNSDVACPEGYRETKNLLWERIEKCFAKELKERLVVLRGSILSVNNVVNKFTDFMNIIGTDLYEQDLIPYPNIPSSSVDHLQQIIDFVTARATYVDEQINALEEVDLTVVPVTSVEVTSELTITENGTGIVIATVLPDNASNKTVTWESSNTDIATVDDNGNVTAISTGNVVITATTVDGGFTDSCNVVVQAETFMTEFKVPYANVWKADTYYPEKDNTICYYAETLDKTARFGKTIAMTRDVLKEPSFSEVSNNSLTLDGFERTYVNNLKGNDVEGFTTNDRSNLYVRIAKSKLDEVSPTGMANYFTENPMNFVWTVDTEKYEYESFKLAELTWTLDNASAVKFKCTNVPFDFTNDDRVFTYIQSNDDLWECSKGNNNDPLMFSSFTGQACMACGTELLESVTLENFIKYLTEQNVKLVYIKEKV